MLAIAKITRAGEWWEYKLPPMLAVVYATAIHAHKNLMELSPKILIWLAGIIIGAAYVSIVNDLTDLKEDEASGKKNRLSKLPAWMQFFLMLLTVVSGFFFAFFFLNDVVSILLYAASWIAFSLYSIPPFRFKKRGIAGVFADAGGAHLFPTLFLVSATVHDSHITMDWVWFSIVGIWALMYGLRGILWHQFFDRDNDLKIGLNTYASKKNPEAFKKQSFFIMAVELTALFSILFSIFKLLPVIGLILYAAMLLCYHRIYRLAIIAVVPPSHQGWHLAMSTYYQFIFPLSLLFTVVFLNPDVWILIAAHLILFPAIAKNTIRDAMVFLKFSLKKLMVR